MIGYAVLDLETTGLRPSWHDRVIEIGVVHLSPTGTITGEWNTLINPERDLGPQQVHGITAADVRHAPTFPDIAGTLTRLLVGRIPVAHNLAFDLNFLHYEFHRIGIPTLPTSHLGICTMREAARYLPHAPRNLAGCCAVADIPLVGHHNALIDAKAAAELLRYYLPLAGSTWNTALHDAARAHWPSLPETDIPWVRRGVSAERDSHFLARLLDRLPRATDLTRADPYLALLDQVLLDHHISATEADALVEMATNLGLCRADVERLHKEYLTALGQAAHADGIVTDTERREITLVAELLDLPPATVRDVLANPTEPSTPFARFTLNPGDLVVFTGEMDGARETWEERARQASYVPHSNITKKVRLLIAADPDTLSGKARKARSYGIPIITPTAFAELIIRPTAQG